MGEHGIFTVHADSQKQVDWLHREVGATCTALISSARDGGLIVLSMMALSNSNED